MQCGLTRLFLIMGEQDAEVPQPRFSGTGSQRDLFGGAENSELFFNYTEADMALIAGMHSAEGIDFSGLPPQARCLYELSADSFCAIVRAWMSELPLTARIIRMGRRILASAGRPEAGRISGDRGDPDVQAVHEAAYKVWHEYHRLMGLLRFSPDADGAYIARCSPDHLALPALGPHFYERFGETPWAVIDEKRRLCLLRAAARPPELFCISERPASAPLANGDAWEKLWRQYHATINNESRNNPALQRQFMPKRYWKYLPEKHD